jgi:hypothetical protein
MRLLYKVVEKYKLGNKAVIEELCFAINGSSLQIRYNGNDEYIIF